MAVPTTPHLNWGGTGCPGERWSEWVPQLQTQALATEEETMPTQEYNELKALISKLRADATGADAKLRTDLAKLRQDATNGDNGLRTRTEALESAQASDANYSDDDAVKAIRDKLGS